MSAEDVLDVLERAAPARRDEADDPALDPQLYREPRNDIGNARRLVRRFGRSLIHVPDLGWHAWVGTHWSRSEGDRAVLRYAQIAAEAIRAEAAAMAEMKEDQWCIPLERGETATDRAEAIEKHYKFAIMSGNAAKLKGMIEIAAADPEISVPRERLDQDLRLLNVANGTIELQGSQRGGPRHRSHRREDLITRCAPVRFDPEAKCGRFDGFLNEILPSPDMQYFLRDWLGYCLTGEVSEQKIALFYGQGANGKSTLLNLLRLLLGEYCQTVPVEAYLEDDRRGGGAATPEYARLPGVRLAMAAEPEKKRRLSTASIKSMSGGEPMVVRPLYGGFVEFQPQFKSFLSFNDRPIIPAQDEGMWRRLMLIPFDQIIPPERRVARLEQALALEGAGILNWLLAGFLCWSDQGLVLPEAVLAATSDYRDESDPIGQFMDICTEKRKGASASAKELFEAYEAWCKANAFDPMNKLTFGKRLTTRGLRKTKSSVISYADIYLLDEHRRQGSLA